MNIHDGWTSFSAIQGGWWNARYVHRCNFITLTRVYNIWLIALNQTNSVQSKNENNFYHPITWKIYYKSLIKFIHLFRYQTNSIESWRNFDVRTKILFKLYFTSNRRSGWQSNNIVPRLARCWFRPSGPKSASSKAAGAYSKLNFPFIHFVIRWIRSRAGGTSTFWRGGRQTAHVEHAGWS